MDNVNTRTPRWKRRLACLLVGVLVLSPLAVTQSSSSYDPYDEQRRGGDWTVPAIVAGAAAAVVVANWLRNRHAQAREPTAETTAGEENMLARLRQQGPSFAPEYNTSALAAVGMVRGGWPFVLDFAHERPVRVTIRLSARGLPEIYTLQFSFGADETGAHRLQFWLPPEFGASERPAAIAVTATDLNGERPEPSFRITALGCGPRAIGSVAIEEVAFLPRLIRPQADEQASYRFFSHSDFPNAIAEFMRVEAALDGERHFFVNQSPITGGVIAGRSIDPRQWDGRDTAQRISTGTHRLKVRASSPTEGWITAWSDSRVDVSP